jgi:transcriptional regulator of acetoin/glycerol metabolism
VYRKSQFGYRVRFETQRARQEMIDAYQAAGCVASAAAERLGIGRRSFDRYAKALEIDLAGLRPKPVEAKKASNG